jgi:hypothetical protein
VSFILGQQYRDYGRLDSLFQKTYSNNWCTNDSEYLNGPNFSPEP